jgi:hypothetical protein
VPLSSPACDNAWRGIRTQQFCGNECAAIQSVSRYFSSASHVIAGTAIAAHIAGNRHGGNSGVARTAATSKARKDGSTIATASGNIAGAAGKCKGA